MGGLLKANRALRPKVAGYLNGYVLFTPAYPGMGGSYGGEFIHRRVLHYREQGIGVTVVKMKSGLFSTSIEQYEGVNVCHCSFFELNKIMKDVKPKKMLVHFMNRSLYKIIKDKIKPGNTFVWIHGFEARNPKRLKYNFSKRELLIGQFNIRRQLRLMREVVADPAIKKIFVSNFLKNICEEDVGAKASNFAIIPNFIDGSLFEFNEKHLDARKRVLLIRPFTAANYANDLAVKAILSLRQKPFFEDIQFSIFGFGQLFDDLVEPIKNLKNVSIVKGYLQQSEIARLHKEHGIMLVPTRFDTQNVTMGEAMSSGLVPVTNEVAAIPEFLEADHGILALAEDAEGLAKGIERLYEHPEDFLNMSTKAAQQIQNKCGYGSTIAKEIAIIQG
jgi:glycosyltransferase involved in cell wall biosynthesis